MGIGEILSIALIAAGVIAVILALFWTKIVKPSTFGYTSKSIIVKWKLKKIFKNLFNSHKIIKSYQNVCFDLTDINMAIIDSMYFGNDFIYIVSNSFYWNIKEIIFSQNKLKIITTRNKELDLPLDIDFFLKATRSFNKNFDSKEHVKIIVPCLNKNFKNININNIHYMKIVDIDKFIQDLEISIENKIEVLQKTITLKIKKQKIRRRIFPKKTSQNSF